MNNTIHLKFGQKGIAIIAPSSHLIAYVVIAVHPPYPVLVVIFMLAGFGNGCADAAWSKYITLMINKEEREREREREKMLLEEYVAADTTSRCLDR
jgi:MFS family permease